MYSVLSVKIHTMKRFFNRYGAYLVALVVFVCLACIYCRPSLQGNIVYAGDTNSFKGMVNETVEYTKATGDHSFWTGSMFSGMPNYQIGGGYYKSSALLKPLKKILLAGHSQSKTPAILLLYFVCFYILLRCFRVDKWLSIAGAIAIGLSSYFLIIIPAGHITKTSTIALMAVVVGGFHLIFRKRYGWGFVLTVIPTAVGFVNHPQMAYYICMLIGVLFFAELYSHIKERRLKDFGIGTLVFVCALLIGLGCNSANVFANREYAEQTMRGGHSDLAKAEGNTNKTSGLDLDYATQWSYGIDETLSFLIPGAKGGASGYNVGKESKLYKEMTRKGVDRRTAAQFCENVPLYWGDQPFTSGNVYMGAVVCFLFVLGLIIVKGPYKWALLVATLFSILLAWGNHFMPLTEFFFRTFPLYNKFRTVSSILIVAEITMPLLGFLAVKELMDGSKGKADKQTLRAIYVAAGVTAGLCIILALFSGTFFSFSSPADAGWKTQVPDFVYQGIISERKSLFVSDSMRSAGFILLAALVLWVFAQGKLKKEWMALILAVLVTLDMWPVDKRYFNDSNFVSPRQNSAYFAMQPWEKQVLADDDPHFRVLNLTTNTFNDSRTSYYLKSLGGYSAAKLRRYQDLIDRHLSKMNMKVVNMLNAKYIVTAGADGQPRPVLNPDAMGNAWFVDSLVVVDGANAESDALNTLDLRTTAVLDKTFASSMPAYALERDSMRTVRLTKYTPHYIDYETHAASPGTVVFSEIYYPYGWKATIDGQPVPHYRVDYMLRALNVPAGHHAIRFIFDPDSVRKGDTLSVACVALMYTVLLVLAVIGIFRLVRSKKDC